MREVAEKSIGWLILLGIAGAIWLGRKAGRNRLNAATAAARAEGRAAAVAEITATQHVQVAVDASQRGGGVAYCSCRVNPWACEIHSPALLAVLRSGGPGVPGPAELGVGGSATDRADHYHVDDDHDDDHSPVDGPWLGDGHGRRQPLVRHNVARAAGAVGRGAAAVRVDPVPGETLNGGR